MLGRVVGLVDVLSWRPFGSEEGVGWSWGL